MACSFFSIWPSKSTLCPSSHRFVSQDADLCGVYQPGPLALWLPAKFGQWEALTSKQRREERMWNHYSPTFCLLSCSAVGAKFIYPWAQTLSVGPTGWRHTFHLVLTTSPPFPFRPSGPKWSLLLTNTKYLTISCCFPELCPPCSVGSHFISNRTTPTQPSKLFRYSLGQVTCSPTEILNDIVTKSTKSTLSTPIFP